jgi:hypothetical protein
MKKTTFSAVLIFALLAGAGVSEGQNTSREPGGSDPYGVELPPLTVAQCGQCHPHIFRNIRNEGGKHRIPCQDCHEQFHAYNPVKNNWLALMPKCDQCHQQPHGEKMVNCLVCHTNPHAPTRVAMDDTLISACGDCHSQPTGELAKFPSAHTKQGCATCHQAHGQIPSCLECHTPHVKNQAPATCLACHPAHKPLQVGYDTKTDTATCGSCHTEAFTAWQQTGSKHGQVNCAECHQSHGSIPKCDTCHGKPHDRVMLEKFPGCLDCHLDAHDLPVKK